LAKLLFGIGLSSAVAKASKTIFDIDSAEMDKIQKLIMSKYRRYNALVYFRDTKGKTYATDLSYILPTGDMEGFLKAVYNGDWDVASQRFMAHPMFDLLDMLRYGTESWNWNKPIRNENDPWLIQMRDTLSAMARKVAIPASAPLPWIGKIKKGGRSGEEVWALTPGLSGHNIKRLIEAINGIQDKYGRILLPAGELLNNLVGLRVFKVDPEVQKKQTLKILDYNINKEVKNEKIWFASNPNASEAEKKKRRQATQRRLANLRDQIKEVKAIDLSKIVKSEIAIFKAKPRPKAVPKPTQEEPAETIESLFEKLVGE